MKKIFALTLIVLVLFVFVPTIAQAAPNTTFTINIYRVQMIDPIENLSEGAADWHYRITVTDDVRTQEITFNDDEYYENDEIVFNNYHTVTVESITVVVSIYLYDADSSGNEVADISGNGVQTTLTFLYDLGTNLITAGDQPQVDGDYYYTSGEFDGSTSSDQNDASLWFQLSDNYVFPVAELGPDKVAATGVATSFDGSLSIASSGSSIELYQWDFDGDGVFDAEGIQTSFTFAQRGLYVLTLKVTDNFGRSSVDTCFVNVTSPPVALFSVYPIVPETSDEISFVDSSIDSDGAVISWYWEFGDGATSTARNPTHQYSVNGTYNIRLTVTDNDGATDTMEFSLFVNATYNLPVANAGADQNVASGENIVFDGSLSTASPASFIETYQWDFDGDGVFDAEGLQTSYTYTEKGTFSVVLKVTDNIGETDTDTCVVVVVNSAPTSQFTSSPVSPTIFDTINFTETSTDIDGTISSWEWDFGDGTTSVERNPSHQYSQTGTYQVRLTVTDDEGEENTKTVSVTVVNLAPTADFSCSKSSEILMNEPIQFTDNSTDPEDAIVSWLWDFGDGETSTVQNPSHEFESSGEHLVTLVVTDEDGSTDTASLTVNVTGNVEPTANFVCSNTEPVAGNEIVFSESSTDQDGNIVTWNWDFGDGKTSTQQNPSHKYDRPGEYTVTLTVTDNLGAQDTYSTNITIQPSFMEQYMLLIVFGVLAVVVIVAVVIGIKRRRNTLQIEDAPQSY